MPNKLETRRILELNEGPRTMTAEISVDSATFESDEDFEVLVDFAFAVPRHESPGVEGKEYVISLHAESLGTRPNKIIGTRTGTTPRDGLEHDTRISVAAGTLPPGAYKLASTLVVKGSPVAGYAEGPIIEIN